MTMRFISIMHFHLPNPIISPDMRAPIADPAVVTDCTIVYSLLALLLSISSFALKSGSAQSPVTFTHPPPFWSCLISYGLKAVFHDPIEYPNCKVPILTVIKSANKYPFLMWLVPPWESDLDSTIYLWVSGTPLKPELFWISLFDISINSILSSEDSFVDGSYFSLLY